jgi:hypothetical protein
MCVARVPMSWESDMPKLRGEKGLSRYKYRIKSTRIHLPETVGPKSFGDGTISCISTLHGVPAFGVNPRLSCISQPTGAGKDNKCHPPAVTLVAA